MSPKTWGTLKMATTDKQEVFYLTNESNDKRNQHRNAFEFQSLTNWRRLLRLLGVYVTRLVKKLGSNVQIGCTSIVLPIASREREMGTFWCSRTREITSQIQFRSCTLCRLKILGDLQQCHALPKAEVLEIFISQTALLLKSLNEFCELTCLYKNGVR